VKWWTELVAKSIADWNSPGKKQDPSVNAVNNAQMNSDWRSLIALAEFLEKCNVSDFGQIILEADFAIKRTGRKGFQVLWADV
jgi:hypothetical protein